jgi:hypothetical protein
MQGSSMFNVNERIRLQYQVGSRVLHMLSKKSIDQNQKKPLKMKNVAKGMDEDQEITAFSYKLDVLAKLLDLHPYDEDGQLEDKLQPVSHKLIQPVHVLCPNSMECETANCNSRSLLQSMQTRDIPQVTLIKNSVIYDDVFFSLGNVQPAKPNIWQIMKEQLKLQNQANTTVSI